MKRLLYCSVVLLPLFVAFWGVSTYYENASAKVSSGNELKFKQISAGYNHSCAIGTDNNAYCWGDGQYGQLGDGTLNSSLTPVAVTRGEMPASANIRQITVGSNFTCVIASDSKAYCWGLGTSGRLGNGALVNKSSPVAVLQGDMPVGATIRQIDIGNTHACAIASDNKAYCWGAGGSGRLGYGGSSDQTTPRAVAQGAIPAGATIKYLSAGGTHGCAIASDNKAYCWGSGTSGGLGNGDIVNQATPVAVLQGAIPAGQTFERITAASNNTCVIASDNKAYCWGANDNGFLGNGTTTAESTAVAVSQGAIPSGATLKQVSSYDHHTCVVASDNKAYCWGSGGTGRLGNNSSSNQSVPVAVLQGSMSAGATILQVSAGQDHTCAVASDDKAYCWGLNSSGQLGDGDSSLVYKNTPVSLATTYRPVAVSQSAYRVYGPSATSTPGSPLATDNTSAALSTIAGDFRIRIGLTNTQDPIPALDSLALGDDHTCAVASNNRAYCWGDGQDGQLGNGSIVADNPAPIAVLQGAMPDRTIRQIAAGGDFTCAIGSDNKAYCWGDSLNYQTNIGTTTSPNVPTATLQGAMPAGATIKQIALGFSYGCAIASDGKVYCWGANNNGQLGNGSLAAESAPIAVLQGEVPAGVTFKQITTGTDHTCGIGSDNKAYCWGDGEDGHLGNGDITDRYSPVAVLQGAMPAGVTFLQIQAGNDFTCALASDHKMYCWGWGLNGHLGNGSLSNQSTPVAVSQGAMPAGTTVQRFSTGSRHTCVIASNLKAYCWGWGSEGRLGYGSPNDKTTPVAVEHGAMPSAETYHRIVAGGTHSCAIASTRKMYCWGQGIDGQLANNAIDPALLYPVATVKGAMEDMTATISASALNLSLQVAPLGVAATCSAVASGWEDITATSPFSWGASPPSHGSAIGAFGSDPATPTSAGYAYQSTIQNGNFTNLQSIDPQQTGLWDAVLHDRSSRSATSYCVRVVSLTQGTSIDTYAQYPRVETALGFMSVQFVDSNGGSLVDPDTLFSSVARSESVQVSTAVLLDDGSKRLRTHNSSSNSGWNISLAATGGPSSSWESGSDMYPYNASTSTEGQLTVDMTSSRVAPSGIDPTGAACAETGLINGSGTATYSDVVSAITLLTGSPSSQFNCNWYLRSVSLSQTIPPGQSAGSYTLEMTATIVAN